MCNCTPSKLFLTSAEQATVNLQVAASHMLQYSLHFAYQRQAREVHPRYLLILQADGNWTSCLTSAIAWSMYLVP